MKKKLFFILLFCFNSYGYKKKLDNPFKTIPSSISLKKLHEDPKIFLLNNFISAYEAQHMKKLAESRMQPSLCDENQKNEGRTSYSAMFANNQDPITQNIAQRAADMVGYPVSHVEGLQVVRYQKGQEFKPHYDYLPEHMKKNRGSQRIFTFFIYLNDVADNMGGKTCFPELKLEVKPQKLAALFWPDVDKTGKEDPRTLHGGMPVQEGEKWAINLWIHDKPQS